MTVWAIRRPRGLPLGNDVARRFFAEPLSRIGIGLLAFVVLVTLLGPIFYTRSPDRTSPYNILQGPSRAYPLGTDELGRDVLARLMHAGALSIPAGIIAVGVGAILGSLLGIIAGYVGGSFDFAFMRFIDVMLAFPTLLMALVVVAILGPGMIPAIVAVSIATFPSYARVLRGTSLGLRRTAFIDAARVSNTPLHRMIRKHVIPNVADVLVVLVVIGMGNGIVVLASLSFLGIGIQPPRADWGVMLSEGVRNITTAPVGVLAPATALIITVLAINLIGEGLGAALRVDVGLARQRAS
jgi:ABC-type dipeptide/oligopeptide/nickel transport system permease subunit